MKFYLALVYFYYLLRAYFASKTSTSTGSEAKFGTDAKFYTANGVGIGASFKNNMFMSSKFLKNKLKNKNGKINPKTQKALKFMHKNKVAGLNPDKDVSLGISKTIENENPSALDLNTPEYDINNYKTILYQEDAGKTLGKDDQKPLWMGWLKFYKYIEKENQPTQLGNFYINPTYTNLRRMYPKVDPNSPRGKQIFPPTEFSFYGHLYNDKMLISRTNLRPSVFEVINLSQMNHISDAKDKYDGGLTKAADPVNPNDHCLKLKTKVTGQNFIWFMCVTDVNSFKSLLKNTKEQKIRMQHESGLIGNLDEVEKNEALRDKKDTVIEIIEDKIFKKQNLFAKPTNSTTGDADGYWVILQDWTQCDLKCGGGNSTLHRLCVPPQRNGKRCEGSPILTRPCNTQPCPNNIVNTVQNTPSLKNASIVIEEKAPKFEVLPFSDRPQRYEKCRIKESDLMMITTENNYDTTTPVRVIMNNRTITAFEGNNVNTLKIGFRLPQTKLIPSIRFENCFELREAKETHAVFCSFNLESTQEFYNEWSYDFNLFKYQCHEREDVVNTTFIAKMDQKLNTLKVRFFF